MVSMVTELFGIFIRAALSEKITVLVRIGIPIAVYQIDPYMLVSVKKSLFFLNYVQIVDYFSID